MNRRKIFKICMAVSLLISTALIIVFKNKIAVSLYSLFTAAVMIGISIHGVLCYYCRNKGNYLRLSIGHLYFLEKDIDAARTDEYKKSFFRDFLIYWIPVPFYIPCIFLCHSLPLLALPAANYLIVRILYAAIDISKTIKDVNSYRLNSEKEQKELLDQQRKEEMGRFR